MNRIAFHRSSSAAILLVALLILAPRPARAGNVILQYFEARWETIERRLPDIFIDGYHALWVPPPTMAETGGFSVGYDTFDRFNLGTPSQRTLYGSTEDFRRLSQEMDRADISLYIDTVLNHNGFRDADSTANDGVTNFEAAGGYPGFVTRLSGAPEEKFITDIDGDFHGKFDGGDLNGRLAGLIDIAQEKNHVFIRHPAEANPSNGTNIPRETPNPANRRFYPDRDMPQEFGRYPFNTADPMAGDPVAENATGLLLRYVQWMVEVNGVDGFRLDAEKHIPTFFFNDYYDPTLFNVARDSITGGTRTPFSFGEVFTGDFGTLGAYTRKDGFGNRDVLDFPLFFTARDTLGAGGFGDLRNLEFASFDGSDGNANDGSRGVTFVSSHDEGNIAVAGYLFRADHSPAKFGLNNIAYAHLLTRTGYPVVYYNAYEFGLGRPFPKDGRGDALGNFDSEIITRLVALNKVRGAERHLTRWIDGDTYVYERDLLMLVGINDRGDGGFDQRTVQTSMPNTTFVELSGNATDPDVDPFDDIFDSVTSNGSGVATIRIPRNTSAGGNFHGRGYVIYGPAAPDATLTITNATGAIGPDPDTVPEYRRRLHPLRIVTGDTIDVALDVSGSGPAEDNALLKLDYGLPIDANDDGSTGVFITGGRFEGFEQFTDQADPTQGGGTGTYRLSIDATGLDEGLHFLETVAFLPRPGGFPAIYDDDRAVIYLDREPPSIELLAPSQTGSGDITASSFQVAVGVDRTANNVHILLNVDAGLSDDDIVNTLLSGATQAFRYDRLEWRRSIDQLTDGTIEITVVAFEETGNRRVQRFGGIDVSVPQPEVFFGFDDDGNGGTTTFLPLPASSNDPAFGRDLLVRVDTDGGALSWNAGDFDVELIVDDGAPIAAMGFDPARTPNTLFQNDQNFGDGFDEFRFVWRGYTTGIHTFRARARLDGEPLFNEAIANIFIEANILDGAITITNPPPPDPPTVPVTVVDDPSEIVVEGTFAGTLAFAQVFLDLGEEPALLAGFGAGNPPPVGAFSTHTPVASFQHADVIPAGALPVSNGVYTVRALGSTGANGGGIATSASSALEITGVGEAVRLPIFAADGDALADLLTPLAEVLAVSPADGNGAFTDFGLNGSMTELRARVDGDSLFVALRGEFFGDDETNDENITLLLIDVAAGTGAGITNLATQLTDTSDALRTEISAAQFSLDGTALPGVGVDCIVAVSAPNITAGYTLGGADLPADSGSPSEFHYQPGINVAYDAATDGAPGAPGTAIAGGDTIEIRIPLAALGDPDLSLLRFAAVTSNDSGSFPSSNTLPENASNAAGTPQVLAEMAKLTLGTSVVFNEISLAVPDRIELFNPLGSTVDLSGWTIGMDDAAGERRDYLIPDGVSIAAGGYLVLSDEGGLGAPPPDTAERLYAGFNITWDASRGGAAWLIDSSGAGVDYLQWLDDDGTTTSGVLRNPPYGTLFGVDGPLVAPSPLQSLGRDASSSDTDSSDDWENSGGVDSFRPTFGAQNTATPDEVFLVR